jgi:site-specific DNA recombinase
MRTAIYLRVSTDEQAEEGFSLDAQERMCRMAAEIRGWTVVELYRDDGYSGRSDDRPALQRLVKDLRSGKANAVIVHKLDRLARNLHLMLGLVKGWNKDGIAFLSVSEQMDFSTPMGIVVLQILGAIAEWYSNNLAQETKKGLTEKARQGGWVGSVPYGYRLVDGALVVVDEERQAVIAIFELYATGQYSYSEIADWLNARSFTIMDWRRTGRHPFGEYSVRSILDNRSYLGYVSSSKVEYQGKHEAIIDQALWDRAQRVRQQRSRKGRVSSMKGTFVPSSPLNGLIYCNHCKSTMHWHPKKQSHCYYRCNGIRAKVCKVSKLANFEVLHEMVRRQLQALAVPDELHEPLADLVQQINERRRQGAPAVDRAAIESKLKRLARIYADGHLDEYAYDCERQQLRALLEDEEMPVLAGALRRADIKHALLFFTRLPNVYAIATPDERAALMRMLFKKLWIEKGQLKAVTPTPLYAEIIGAWGYMATPGRVELPTFGFGGQRSIH